MRLKLDNFLNNIIAIFVAPRVALVHVKSSRSLMLCLALLFASTASAGTINYPGPDDGPDGPGGMDGWMGDTVWYAGVSESNAPTESRFGAPASITGDSIDFNPQNFEAAASGGSSQITDSQLNFMVVSLGSSIIENLQFSEAGDTTLAAVGTDLAFTSVSASIFIDVVELDGVGLGIPVNISGSMTFTPSAGDYQVGVDGGPVINGLIWTGSVLFDIEAELALQGIHKGSDYDNGATKLNVAIDNTLTALTSGGASAFIRKKDFDGLTVTSNVPEPTTMMLAALGLISTIATRRRRLG